MPWRLTGDSATFKGFLIPRPLGIRNDTKKKRRPNKKYDIDFFERTILRPYRRSDYFQRDGDNMAGGDFGVYKYKLGVDFLAGCWYSNNSKKETRVGIRFNYFLIVIL